MSYVPVAVHCLLLFDPMWQGLGVTAMDKRTGTGALEACFGLMSIKEANMVCYFSRKDIVCRRLRCITALSQ
jgi:hypothetical protein